MPVAHQALLREALFAAVLERLRFGLRLQSPDFTPFCHLHPPLWVVQLHAASLPSLDLSFTFRAMGIAPVHLHTLEAFHFPLPRGCCVWGQGIPQTELHLVVTLATTPLRIRPALQTAQDRCWDRLLPDGQACSLLSYVMRLCKGSWPAYIKGGGPGPSWGRGGS